MGLLVPYIRNADGSIVRVSDGIYESSTKDMAPYLFEEKLHGWPEPKVYWAKKSGPCLGVAPSTSDLKVINTDTAAPDPE
ncbi:hypothetical protein [Nitrosovibrio tenuis]|uniref:Uncharacterized protein n=1 Tax=Nitrosovibrio tenuis TaxID=1233 RepID=A0A1H7R2H3_9PROT|nr:hypothetical protein [Nitrosovibrio tenuis]SEL54178.1 hypothetical protein SAMN05216387_11450 [Nitrosovibrio tenuis]